MKKRPTQVTASLKRHPSHPRGSHVGTCIGPQTCTYRGQTSCKPSAARHIHELLLSPHATSGRLGHVCNSVAASLQRHQTSHPRGSHAKTCISPHTCNFRRGKNACRPPKAPPHAASCSVPHVCNGRVRNLYRSPEEVGLQRHSRVTAEQELRLQRHTSQEQDPRAKAHADNGMTCVCNNLEGNHGAKVEKAAAESRSRHRIHPHSAPALRRPDTPCSIGIPDIRRPTTMIFWSLCHARIAAQTTAPTNGMSIAGRTPWRLLVRLRCLVMA